MSSGSGPGFISLDGYLQNPLTNKVLLLNLGIWQGMRYGSSSMAD